MRRRTTALIAAALLGLAVTAASSTVAGPATAEPGLDRATQYEVHDARSLAKRNLVAGTGVAIDNIDHGVLTVTATGAELKALRSLGFKVTKVPAQPAAESAPSTLDFPSRDAAYHN